MLTLWVSLLVGVAGVDEAGGRIQFVLQLHVEPSGLTECIPSSYTHTPTHIHTHATQIHFLVLPNTPNFLIFTLNWTELPSRFHHSIDTHLATERSKHTSEQLNSAQHELLLVDLEHTLAAAAMNVTLICACLLSWIFISETAAYFSALLAVCGNIMLCRLMIHLHSVEGWNLKKKTKKHLNVHLWGLLW